MHGLIHNDITNAWRGAPYPIDTLLIFMANMAWNSTMNTVEGRRMVNDKGEDGEYRIPFLVVWGVDATEALHADGSRRTANDEKTIATKLVART